MLKFNALEPDKLIPVHTSMLYRGEGHWRIRIKSKDHEKELYLYGWEIEALIDLFKANGLIT